MGYVKPQIFSQMVWSKGGLAHKIGIWSGWSLVRNCVLNPGYLDSLCGTTVQSELKNCSVEQSVLRRETGVLACGCNRCPPYEYSHHHQLEHADAMSLSMGLGREAERSPPPWAHPCWTRKFHFSESIPQIMAALFPLAKHIQECSVQHCMRSSKIKSRLYDHQ